MQLKPYWLYCLKIFFDKADKKQKLIKISSSDVFIKAKSIFPKEFHENFTNRFPSICSAMRSVYDEAYGDEMINNIISSTYKIGYKLPRIKPIDNKDIININYLSDNSYVTKTGGKVMEKDKIELINKAFLEILPSLADFIGRILKQKDEKYWWKKYVIDKLSDTSIINLPKVGSYEECINSLDIRACFDIIIKNGNEIFIKILKRERLSYAHLLKDRVINITAHTTTDTIKSITEKDVKRTLENIAFFMEPIDINIAENIRLNISEYEKSNKNNEESGKDEKLRSDVINNDDKIRSTVSPQKKDNKNASIKHSTATDSAPELQLKYWYSFKEYFTKDYKEQFKKDLRKPQPRHFYEIPIGISDFYIT